uniref:Uncharacterized protein n=1 Tax=Glossina pallidipes TaxID=7398 RepID=A0A1A9ZGU4_GLOPL
MPSSVSSKDNSFSTFSKACCISHTGLHINFTDSACGAEEAVIIITDCEMTSASTAHSLSGKTIRPSPTAPEMSMSLVSVSLVFDESLSDFLLFFFKDCSVTSSLPDSIRALAKTAILLVSPMQFLAIQQYVPMENHYQPVYANKFAGTNVTPKLTASHVYVPNEVGSSALAVKANISPALISFESLNHLSWGVGTPTTLHSNATVPCCVKTAFNSSINSGTL